MTKRFSLYLIFAVLIFGCVWPALVSAENEAKQLTLLTNEEYVGVIDHKLTRYLKVTLVNLAAETATCRIAFYKERIELSADRMGPVEYRTFTLENQDDHQTRIWTTLNFDEFTLNVTAGHIQVTIEKPLQLR